MDRVKLVRLMDLFCQHCTFEKLSVLLIDLLLRDRVKYQDDNRFHMS